MKKLKKLIAGLLCFLLLFGLTAFADTSTSERVKEVLIKVKEKVDILESFTNFESSEQKNEDGKTNYGFYWNNDDYSITVNVNSDENGNISYYYFRDRNLFNNPDLKRLSKVKKEDAFFVADSFLRKIAPECFSNENDGLIYFEKNSLGEASSRGTYYNFSYKRMKNGVLVGNNIAEVSVFAGDENNITVSSVSINYDYSASFEEEKTEIENPEGIYIKTFPAEMIYERDNYYYRKDSEKKTNLIYRIKDNNIGYISAYTGEIIEPDPESYFREFSGSVANKNMLMQDSAAEESVLSPLEMKELETISGLMSADEIRKTLEKMPYLDFSDKLEKASESITKNDERYVYSASYRLNDGENERYLRYTAEAQSGKILSVSNNRYELYKKAVTNNEYDLTEAQWKETDKKVSEILNFAAKEEIKECAEEKKEFNSGVAYYSYIRKVNGIKYPSNSITVSFDIKKNSLANYNFNFTNDTFENPQNAIDEKTAYEKILNIAPLTKVYVKSGGSYKLCYGLDNFGNLKIDAFSGENLNGNSIRILREYSDISSHWCKEAVMALNNVGIAFDEESFNPDVQITQADLLRFLAAGVYHSSYMDLNEEDLYELMINDGVIKEGEKSPDAFVKREDAFCYLVRLSGLEKVARMSTIFKTDFADGSAITPSKTGYAAILSGFGVVEGNGGVLNPKNNITRAETASMLYKYLLVY